MVLRLWCVLALLSTFEIQELLRAKRFARISFDLGISYEDYPVRRSKAFLDVGRFRFRLDELKKAAKARAGRVFRVEDLGEYQTLVPLVLYSTHVYQLIQPRRGIAPTVEIDGIHMHRVKDIDPFIDAREKVQLLSIKQGMHVLDICTGLGYTAIWEQRMGGIVTTVEKDENVLELARINPWSKELWNAEVINEDALDFVPSLESSSFDRILHDPPRFALAGELYSREFYEELYRILKPGGVLYHYVGEPGKKSGKDFTRGVMRRLRSAGFREVRRVYFGVVARK